uniref:PAS domain S-box protein n=1 Tax=Haloterrigena alkaliphila TaxID=2816475 RepID=A0A8A2VJU3_9EURY
MNPVNLVRQLEFVRVRPSVEDPRADVRELFGLLERVRERDPELPIVLLVDDPSPALDETIDSYPLVDWLRRADSIAAERLRHRIRSLVERRRLAALTQRSLTGVELTQDAIAIVTPDGIIEFANRAFAMQFGYDHEALVGQPWRTLFTDESVEHLEATAIPTVADGWRWTGSCTGRRRSGRTIPVTVRLGGPEDGSLVFVVAASTADEDDETA